jgi:RNA polymerase sigma-B factor
MSVRPDTALDGDVAQTSIGSVPDPYVEGVVGESDYLYVGHLFARLADARSDDEFLQWRQRIISRCMPLADHIAFRFVNRGEPREDLLQVARLALVKAVDRYQPSKGRFVSFAVPTIMGEVRRHFRDNTWGMHVPRRVQENHLLVRETAEELSQRLGRAPMVREVAAELDLERQDVAQSIYAGRAYRPMSLDATVPGEQSDAQTLAARQGAEDPSYSKVEDLITLGELVRDLAQRDRMILRMRFYDCLTQKDIAQRLGVSQVHVSRLLSQILEHLRTLMCTEAPVMIFVVLVVTGCS